jgi:ankyrin repeat protein
MEIGNYLEKECDINSAAQINRLFYSLLNSYLYRINARSSRPALIWATERGNEGNARMSIEEGPATRWTDWHGQGLLCRAASLGHDGILRLLLEHGNIDVDITDGES